MSFSCMAVTAFCPSIRIEADWLVRKPAIDTSFLENHLYQNNFQASAYEP